MSTFLPVLTGPEIAMLLVAVLLAGLVRGFAGFGTAMVFVPLAGHVLSPVEILTAIVVFDLLGPLPLLRSMARDASRVELTRLSLGALIGIPLGLYLLTSVSPESFRLATCLLIFALCGFLASGWRYTGTLGAKTTVGIGVTGGFMGGFAGIPGPPVILTYLSSKRPAAEIRANIFLYLFITEFLIIATLGARGLLTWSAITLGLLLTLPYLAGELFGARLFDPARERIFRATAYAIILASAVLGLPFWN